MTEPSFVLLSVPYKGGYTLQKRCNKTVWSTVGGPDDGLGDMIEFPR